MPQTNGISGDEKRIHIKRKIPGGKLLECRLVLTDGVITEINYLGDFFMHPEEAVEELEKSLNGVAVGDAPSTVERFFSTRDVELAGVSPEDFVSILRESIGMKGVEDNEAH